MRPNSMAGKAYVHLKQLILSNELPKLTRLKEEEYAKQIGVSRMAVREALTRLLGEDLVVMGAKSGYYQKNISEQEMRELMELREIIELAAIRLAAVRMQQHQFDDLDRICDQFSEMFKSKYFQGAHEADLKFHETLVQFSANRKLLKVYQVSSVPQLTKWMSVPSSDPTELKRTDVEHRDIIRALRLRDSKLAEQYLIKHFSRSATSINTQRGIVTASHI